MDHTGIINISALGLEDNDCFKNLEDVFRSFFSLNTKADRFILYVDTNNGSDFRNLKVSDSFTMDNFLSFLEESEEMDLLLALQELDDKSPAMDHLNETDINRLLEQSLYFPFLAFEEGLDFISIAYLKEGILLSPSRDMIWQNHYLEVARNVQIPTENDFFEVKNISNIENALALKREILDSKEIRISIFESDILKISPALLDWFDDLDEIDKLKLRNKINSAINKKFEVREPLIKKLHDDDGLLELRVPASKGGTIRLFFFSKDGINYLLNAVKKKSTSEDIKDDLNSAKGIYNKNFTNN